jgi:phosphoribosylformylglycinamidine synthase
MAPRVLILRAPGTNCDQETAFAFETAGGKPDVLHLNRLLENPKLAVHYQILAIPGGFSYGDDIAAGRILANQLVNHLGDALRRLVESGRPVIGVCNGFQVLVKTNLLPGPIGGRSGQTSTLAHNDSGRFIDRWVHLAPRPSRCIWTSGLADPLELPIAHGEGKFIPADDGVRKALWANGQVALIYARPDGSAADGVSPHNPNGSVDDIAGVCDVSGLVFGLMPHPERYVDPLQHPAWTRQVPRPEFGLGLQVFRNAVQHVESGVGAGV